MKVALAQFNPTVGALRKNCARIRQIYLEACSAGAALVVFPELAITGYPPKDLLLYSSFIAESTGLVDSLLAPLTHGGRPPLLLGAPYMVEKNLCNAALLLEQGKVKAVHPKTLLPNYDVFDEQRYFTPSGKRRVELLLDRAVGITLCEDLWNDLDFWPQPRYDLDPLAELADQGASLIINLSASPYHYGKQELREKIISFIARKHRLGCLYVNQVGGNDELIFDGTSLVFDKRGELIYRGRSFCEDLIVVDISHLDSGGCAALAPSAENRGTVFEALALGVRDYLFKSGFSRAVLGLSGGIDSAVTAAVAVEALGASNVLGVLMPSPYSSRHSIEDALQLGGALGIETRTIPIKEPFFSYCNLFNPKGELCQDLAEENLQARIRGSILMFIANREGCLTLTTGNKSELAVGYCTLYGDMSGGLAVLADIPKAMVYELAAYINSRTGRETIPARTIDKPPSAELRPNQRDEDSLPPYALLDPILYHYIEENLSAGEISALGYDRQTVLRVLGLVDRAEYKRRQAAPGLKVTTRAFGTGRRMPIARGYEED